MNAVHKNNQEAFIPPGCFLCLLYFLIANKCWKMVLFDKHGITKTEETVFHFYRCLVCM